MVIFKLFETFIILPLIILPLQFLIPSEIKNIKKEVILGAISILGFLLIILHIIIEGLRWQLIPIYIPAFISFSVGIILLIKMYRTKSSEPSESVETVYLRAENATYGLFIDGAKHYNFADLNIWAPFLKDIGYIGPIKGYRMLNIINAYILSFFNEYLKGMPSTLLDGSSLEYPEVHFYSRGT